ncbi:hypothetical protein OTU49_008974 [Cherax quadricarinatus]|uniref:Uncharacterized protein n=1 Tax=Cherax quadricarinatus TaxID=27406 RepID=A0AAW0WAX3_CHEQU|nr:uncharacterized protein LOC128700407 [Cherax quadricarinatus]
MNMLTQVVAVMAVVVMTLMVMTEAHALPRRHHGQAHQLCQAPESHIIMTNLTQELCTQDNNTKCVANMESCLRETTTPKPGNSANEKQQILLNITACAQQLGYNITNPGNSSEHHGSPNGHHGTHNKHHGSPNGHHGSPNGHHGTPTGHHGTHTGPDSSWENNSQNGFSKCRNKLRGPERYFQKLGLSTDQFLPMITCLMTMSGQLDSFSTCINQ